MGKSKFRNVGDKRKGMNDNIEMKLKRVLLFCSCRMWASEWKFVAALMGAFAF